MSHSCPNLVSTSFLYNPYIPFLISRILFLLVSFHILLLLLSIFSAFIINLILFVCSAQIKSPNNVYVSFGGCKGEIKRVHC